MTIAQGENKKKKEGKNAISKVKSQSDVLMDCLDASRPDVSERTWPNQGHRDQLSAFKSVWPLAKPNEASARQRGEKKQQRLIFAANRAQEREWREMRRLQFLTAERLASRPACRQNKSLQIGVPAASRHSAYCDECSEGRHLFFPLPPKVTHIMMTTAK